MKKKLAALLIPLLASACLVGRHGHIAIVSPPAALVAAAVVAATLPGYVWVDGHWDWIDDRWIWHDGEWIAERPGFVWEQGVWLHAEGGYYFRTGHWRPAGPRIEVRDHR
jgi:hypothetical protein